jgi:hypothetical protein
MAGKNTLRLSLAVLAKEVDGLVEESGDLGSLLVGEVTKVLVIIPIELDGSGVHLESLRLIRPILDACVSSLFG